MATMSSEIQLVVFDMEGTLTDDPTLWEIMHLKNGTWESHGLGYWERYKAGGLGYDEFARMDVAAWEGASRDLLVEAAGEVPLMGGCMELMSFLEARGIRKAVVTNGLECLGLRLVRELGIETVEANRALSENGVLTGAVSLRVPFEQKADALARVAERMAVPLARVMAVGDGPADVEMFRRAGVGVAFRPHDEAVAAGADHVVSEPDLRRLIPLFG